MSRQHGGLGLLKIQNCAKALIGKEVFKYLSTKDGSIIWVTLMHDLYKNKSQKNWHGSWIMIKYHGFIHRQGINIVKTSYNRLTYENMEVSHGIYNNIWKIWAQPKIQTFIWRLVHHSIPTKDFLIK